MMSWWPLACGRAGCWRPSDIHLAQWACEHFYVIADVTPRLPRETPSFVAPEDLLYGREEVGGMMVGAFDEDAKTIDAASLPEPFAFTLLPPAWDKIAPYFEKAIAIFPSLETAPIRRFVNGPESFTPDDAPLIGPIPGIGGLHVCTAMNSGGVTYSAAAGHMVADLLAEATPRFDAAAFAARTLRRKRQGSGVAAARDIRRSQPRLSADEPVGSDGAQGDWRNQRA